jgi:hypothetical protein
MPENTDPITLTLDTLRSDVERNPLADSLTVRRRGDRRTRHQAVAGAALVVALVAGVVGLYGGVGDGSRRTAPPASVSPTAEATFALADDPLLLAGQLDPVGNHVGLQRSPDPVDDTVRPLQCLSNPADWGAQQVESASYYDDVDGRSYEHVLRFPDAASAGAALVHPLDDLRGCPVGDASEVTVTGRAEERVPATLADEAYRTARLSTPTAASEPFYYELGVARRANVVVVLEWTSQGSPFARGSSAWAWTPERLAAALERATR